MADIYIPQSDKGFNLNFTITEDDDTAKDLTSYTITIKVWARFLIGSLVVDSACVIDVEADGTCHYAVAAGDFDDAGDFIVELELTQSGVIESTRHYTLEVTESPS